MSTDINVLRRELLAQAIADIQGSIHANDSKSSAGLVVHGLLATGVVALSSRLGDVYAGAGVAVHVMLIIELALALILFVLSVGALLMAVNPYYPEDVASRLPGDPGYAKVFFPDITGMKEIAAAGGDGDGEAVQLTRLIDGLTPENLQQQLTGELLKVADIRDHEARWAQRGFVFLFIEVLCVSAYFATVGIVAASPSHHRSPSQPAINWRVTTSRGKLLKLRTANAAVKIPAPARITARLIARDASGIRTAEITAVSSYACAGRAGVRTVAAPRRQVHLLPPAAGQTTGEVARISARHISLRRRPCPRGARYSGGMVVVIGRAVNSQGAERNGVLRVRAPR